MKKKIVKKTVWLLQDKSTKKFAHQKDLKFISVDSPDDIAYWGTRIEARLWCLAKCYQYKPVKATFQITLA